MCKHLEGVRMIVNIAPLQKYLVINIGIKAMSR